jgi:hypothetical protein
MKKTNIVAEEAEKLERQRREANQRLDAQGWKPVFDDEDWIREGLAWQIVKARLGGTDSEVDKIVRDAKLEVRWIAVRDATWLKKDDFGAWLDGKYPARKPSTSKKRTKGDIAIEAAAAVYPDKIPEEENSTTIVKRVREEIWRLERINVSESVILRAIGRKKK